METKQDNQDVFTDEELKEKMYSEIVQDVINEISGLEFMIAMRFHALVTALKSGIKSIAVNYDIKVEKLANEAGLPLISMDASEDFDFIFGEMKHLNELKLIEFADSHKFDWSGIDEVLLG